MKPTSYHDNNNWLGFSLSSQMKMEASCAHHHQWHHHIQSQHPIAAALVSNAVHDTTFLSPPHLNNSGICYGVEGGINGGIYSQFSVMPLNSDGSLCIMEAINRSQHQGLVPSSSQKLEDFLGGGSNIWTHHQYGRDERETMDLNMNRRYYHLHNHSQEPEGNENHHHSVELLQKPIKQQRTYFQPVQEGLCSAFTGNEMHRAQLEEETMADRGFPSLKNWVFGHCNGGMVSGSVDANRFEDLQSLNLSMISGSHSNSYTEAPDYMALVGSKKRCSVSKGLHKQQVHRKSIDTFGQRTSQYRGVTRHRWTGRYEAHLWDNSSKKEGQTRKGRQIYLGGYDLEEKAARAYDLAALKYWGPSTQINFSLKNYQEELEEMKNMTRLEYVAYLRRRSTGFSRGASIYRGVTRHHQHGRWQARIGRVAGNKDLYLGTFGTQEEAAEAYDIAAIKFRGRNAITNFDISSYDVEKILASDTLLSAKLVRKNKAAIGGCDDNGITSVKNNGRELDLVEEKSSSSSDWNMVLYQSTQQNVSSSESLIEKPMIHGLAQLIDVSEKVGSMHPSNNSSLLTSLISSREVSPDRTDMLMLYTKAPAKQISSKPWPAISMAHMPVFASWNDA